MSTSSDQAPRLHDQHAAACRRRGYALSTECTYRRWIVRYVRFHGTRHPREMGPAEMRAFLSHLATEREVASTTQNQALCALVFLYETVLDSEVGEIGSFTRAKGCGFGSRIWTSIRISSLCGGAKEAKIA